MREPGEPPIGTSIAGSQMISLGISGTEMSISSNRNPVWKMQCPCGSPPFPKEEALLFVRTGGGKCCQIADNLWLPLVGFSRQKKFRGTLQLLASVWQTSFSLGVSYPINALEHNVCEHVHYADCNLSHCSLEVTGRTGTSSVTLCATNLQIFLTVQIVS